MALKSVRVPPDLVDRFERAEETVSRYFKERSDDPERGTIEIFGERYILVRAASLSVEFFSLVRDLYGEGREAEAEDFTRNILFDLAHAIGKSDAQNFHAKMGLEDPIARLSAGPVHFAHAGWAKVDISSESRPLPGNDFYLLYDHPYSFESDAWIRAGQPRDKPACIMNAGYSSGWCEESFGVKLVAAEVLCRAKGDACCRFIMAHPDRIERYLDEYQSRTPGLAVAVTQQIPDFFARKRIEEELRKAKAELETRVIERTADLARSNELLRHEIAEREIVERRLRQTHKLEALGRLAGGIAHDFNNLMGVIIGYSSMLERRVGADNPIHEPLVEITKAGMRAAALTRQLLTFSRARIVQRDVASINQIIADLHQMLERLIGDDVELRLSLDPEAGLVDVDRGQIEQVVVNLVVNARDALPRGGKITVATERTQIVPGSRSDDLPAGDYVTLSVTDDGVGIAPETLAQIFDPFFTTKEPGEGTGLGLSTVYGIARQGGGTVDVKTAPGEGATFSILLPRVVGSRAVGIGVPAPRFDGGETILLVEDQQALRRIVRASLERFGYRIIEAAGEEEALADAREHDGAIHLLLSDVVMPRGSGPSLWMRVREERPELKVLFMSGHAEDAVLRSGVSEGIVPFLPKPFTPEALAAKVREVLDGEMPRR